MDTQSLVPTSPPAAHSNLSGADPDRQLIAQWLLRHQSPHTRSAYAGDVRNFLSHLGDPSLDTITVRDLQAWVSHLSATLAISSVNRKLASVRSLLSYGQQTGYLRFNVGAALRPRRTPDRLAERILPERDCLNLLAATGDTIQGPRNSALLGFLYYTGCRVSEACGLQWRDLHLEDPPTVTIHGKGGRTRHVGLPPVCGEALKRILPKDGAPDDPVFTTRTGRMLSRHEVGVLVKAAARRAGLTVPVSPHWLRHAHATHAMDRGAKVHLVQATLGHASLVTTSRYVHMRPGESSGHALAGAQRPSCPEELQTG